MIFPIGKKVCHVHSFSFLSAVVLLFLPFLIAVFFLSFWHSFIIASYFFFPSLFLCFFLFSSSVENPGDSYGSDVFPSSLFAEHALKSIQVTGARLVLEYFPCAEVQEKWMCIAFTMTVLLCMDTQRQ